LSVNCYLYPDCPFSASAQPVPFRRDAGGRKSSSRLGLGCPTGFQKKPSGGEEVEGFLLVKCCERAADRLRHVFKLPARRVDRKHKEGKWRKSLSCFWRSRWQIRVACFIVGATFCGELPTRLQRAGAGIVHASLEEAKLSSHAHDRISYRGNARPSSGTGVNAS